MKRIIIRPKQACRQAVLFCLAFFLIASSARAFTIVDGYMDKLSYHPGDTALVYLNSSIVIPNWKLYLLDVEGNRKDSVITDLIPQGISNPEPWVNGFGYHVTFAYVIPAHLQSGIYQWENKVFFIVKNPQKNADITIIYPSNTEAAYNEAGGKGLYDFDSPEGRAHTVTFQRPLSTFIINDVRTYCRRFLQWIHSLGGYSFQYIADNDMDDYSEISNSKIIVVPGHSEYWSRNARQNLDSFVNSGKDAMILSGNTMWWQVRYSNDRTRLICYKDKWLDPEPDSLMKTINWPEPSLNYPSLTSTGADFIHGAYGMKPYHGWYGYNILQPGSPLLEGTGLSFHDILSCQSMEYDATLFYGIEPNGDPILDTTSLGFCKIELIGYDWGKSIYFYGPQKSYGTFIAFKKYPTSGNVINVGFTNWCARNVGQGGAGGFGGKDSLKIKTITMNMFNKLLAGENIYSSPKPGCTTVGIEQLTTGKEDLFIFPNPGRGSFHLKGGSLPGDVVQVEIYNTLGSVVFAQDLNKRDAYGFDASSLGDGIYFYLLKNPQGAVGKGKIIIAH